MPSHTRLKTHCLRSLHRLTIDTRRTAVQPGRASSEAQESIKGIQEPWRPVLGFCHPLRIRKALVKFHLRGS